jgi:hypothetical protein
MYPLSRHAETGLVLTDHASVRMSQRIVSLPDVEPITLIGTKVSDGYLVRAQDCQSDRDAREAVSGQVRKLKGTRLVVANGRIVTAYQASRWKQRRLLRNAQERDLDE